MRNTISGNPMVGTYCVLTNNGGLLHPSVSVAQMEELHKFTGIPLCTGTVNRGSDVIGAGLIANDKVAFCGMNTTATELSVIDAIFGLISQDNQIFENESERHSLFDQLV